MEEQSGVWGCLKRAKKGGDSFHPLLPSSSPRCLVRTVKGYFLHWLSISRSPCPLAQLGMLTPSAQEAAPAFRSPQPVKAKVSHGASQSASFLISNPPPPPSNTFTSRRRVQMPERRVKAELDDDREAFLWIPARRCVRAHQTMPKLVSLPPLGEKKSWGFIKSLSGRGGEALCL